MTDAPPTTKRPTTLPKLAIKSTSHLTQTTFSFLFIGEYDTGKTFCSLTFPNPFMIYFDTGLRTLHKFPNVPVVYPKDYNEVTSLLLPAIRNRQLSQLVQDFTDDNGSKPYVGYNVRTLIVDSLTFFGNQNILELGKGGTLELETLQWDDYYARLHSLVNACCNASKPIEGKESYNVIITVHIGSKTDKKGNIIKQGPSVAGRMQDQLANFFDAMLIFEGRTLKFQDPNPPKGQPAEMLSERQRYAWTVDRGLLRAKNQMGPIPPKIIPTYDVLNKAWGLEGQPPAAVQGLREEVPKIETTHEVESSN